MKSCCDEYCANHGCNQGRNCPVRATQMPVAMEDEAFTYAWVVDWLIDLLIVGSASILIFFMVMTMVWGTA